MNEHDQTRNGGRLRLLPLLRRRWWLLVLTTAAVTAAAYLTASTQEETNTAEALAVVPSSSDSDRPRSANDAQALAATYAGVIPQDDRLMRRVASRLHLSPSEVRERVSVTNTTGTALLGLRFEAEGADRAIEGARALARALDNSATPNIPPGTLNMVRGPSTAEANSPGSDTVLLLAGVLVGLFLGGVLMVFLERADARADHERDLEDATGLPATRLRHRSSGPQAALVDRWESLAPERPARVALVPATRRAQRATARAGDALRAGVLSRCSARDALRVGAVDLEHPYDADGPAPEAPIAIQAAAGPGREPSGESVSLSSDVVVLVARRGDSLRRIDARFSELRSLGIEVERMLLVPRRLRPSLEEAAPAR